MFTQRLVPQMQSRYTPLPPRIPNNRGVYKNSWRWHDAEQITRPLDNRTAVRQRGTENSPKTQQIQQHYKTIGEREREREGKKKKKHSRLIYANKPRSTAVGSSTSVSRSACAYITVSHAYA